MYKTLLVATDGSKLSDKALAHAIGMAQAMGSTLTAFYAAPDYPMPAYADGVVYEPVSRKEYAKLAAEDAQKILEAAATKAETAGANSARQAKPWRTQAIATTSSHSSLRANTASSASVTSMTGAKAMNS